MTREALEAAIAMEEQTIASLIDQVNTRRVRVSRLIEELHSLGRRRRIANSINTWIASKGTRNQHGNLRRVTG